RRTTTGDRVVDMDPALFGGRSHPNTAPAARAAERRGAVGLRQTAAARVGSRLERRGSGERSALHLAHHAQAGDPVPGGVDGQPPPLPQKREVRNAGRSIGSDADGSRPARPRAPLDQLPVPESPPPVGPLGQDGIRRCAAHQLGIYSKDRCRGGGALEEGSSRVRYCWWRQR
ncbi:unnamed protein product, partial [Laminaria digitata]